MADSIQELMATIDRLGSAALDESEDVRRAIVAALEFAIKKLKTW